MALSIRAQLGAGPSMGPASFVRPAVSVPRVSRVSAGSSGDLPRIASLRPRHHKEFKLYASSSDGGSSGAGNNNSGGDGGGGGGDGEGKGDDGEGEDKPKKRSGFWKGWDERVAYDPEFPFKVMLEQVIGVGASVIGDMSSRPNWGLNELDFVFSTAVVGSILNLSLMYLLAPTGSVGATAGQGLIAKALSEQTLRNWGAPGGNMFEAGFPVHKRLVNFFYKGIIFSTIGLFAGVIGTSASNGLLELRKKLDPTFVTNNEPPNILFNAMTWSAHMGFSSNLRYQVLGGTDRVLVKVMPIAVFRVYSAIIRGLNNILGGISFVTLARMTGVQKSAAAE